jgi:DNA replication protein DnaC
MDNTPVTAMAPINEVLARAAARLAGPRTRRSHSPMRTIGSGSGSGSNVKAGSPSRATTQTVAPAVNCQMCSDLGFVRADVPLGHPDFGRAIRCSCKADEDRATHAKRAQEASNLKGRLLAKTFANFDCSRSPAAREVCAILREFADAPDGWLLLRGNRGTGKTHLLAAVANALMSRGDTPLYVVVPDFLDYLREGYDAEKLTENASRRMRDARDCPVLLLDDLGVEKRTLWTDEQLYRLLNHRYNEGLPTVIASNVSLDELEPRIASRMQDSSLARMVVLAGEDQRIAGAGTRR